MAKTLLVLLSVFASAILLVGLTFRSTAFGKPDFAFGNGTEPKSLDHHRYTGQPEGRIGEAIFEGLSRRDPETLKPVPGQAESWTPSEDGTTWTFRIRKDARWSNGEPVTAQDFVWAWKRLLEPAMGAEYAYLLHTVKHGEAYNTFGGRLDEARKAAKPDQAEVARLTKALADAKAHLGVDEGFFAPDDSTFVVQLNAFTPYFLELTAFYPLFPVHRKTVEAHPDDWFKPETIVSNGPFVLKGWRIYDRIRLEKNPLYWGASEVRLGSVEALPIETRSTVLNLYLTGALDWAPAGYPPDLVDVVKKRPDFYSGAGMIVYYYRFNCTQKPYDDPRVRHAIGLAFDRKAIVERITRAGQVPTTTFVAPGIPGYKSPPSALGFDPEKARALLAEAGYPGGRGFPKTTILFNKDEGHQKIAEYIAEQLQKSLGIDVNPVNQEWKSYLEDVRRMRYHVARAAWIGDYRDPNTFLDMWMTGNGNNQTGWGDPFYDRLLRLCADVMAFVAAPASEREQVLSRLKEADIARRLVADVQGATDPAARVKAGAALRFHLFREAEAILLQDAFPIIPVYFYVVTGLVQPRVKGFHVKIRDDDGSFIDNLQDMHPLRDLWVEPAAGGVR